MIVVADASPLILLSAIGRLDLLRELYDEVHVPQAVWEEVVTQGRGRPGSHEVAAATWLRVHPAPVPPVVGGLHEGETQAIGLAVLLSADRLVVDEPAARRAAERAGLRVIGVVGVVVAARDAGYLTAVRPALDGLRAAGLRLSQAIYEQVLRAVGESG